MQTIKNTIVAVTSTLLVGAATMVGMMTGVTIWENGLGEAVAKKTQKVFKK